MAAAIGGHTPRPNFGAADDRSSLCGAATVKYLASMKQVQAVQLLNSISKRIFVQAGPVLWLRELATRQSKLLLMFDSP